MTTNYSIEKALRRAYKDLCLRYGVHVRLPLPPGSHPTCEVRDALRLVELRRPYVVLFRRDGYPHDSVWVVAAESEDHVWPLLPALRPGPNGPIDSVTWLRRGESET